jgi:phosphotransferase system enzyme I (PtsI)/phosphotransferase system enzyme I (PtsP)
MVRDGFPSEEEQLNIYRHVLEAYRGKPVYLRVLDIGGDKALPYFPIREENPALGWRGIRFCLDNSPLLMTQVRAMLRADAGSGALSILLPMVSATRELQRFRELLSDALSQLQEEGHAVVRPRVGVMVEVPAAISQLPLWREQIDFISIGTNDLSQYLLAVDRNNARVAASYDHFNPAVVREIARIADISKQLDLPVSVCGEMSSDPGAAILLIAMGIRTLSMSAAQLPRIKWLVQHLDLPTAEGLMEKVMLLSDSAQIRKLLKDFLLEIDFPGLRASARQ